MSALNLLSVIAPAVANVPQGAAEKAESGFQTLLAALSGDEAGTAEPGTDVGDPMVPGDRQIDAKAGTGVPIIPIPAPLTFPPVVAPPAEGEGDASTDGKGQVAADPATFPLAPGDADEASDGPRTFPFAPVDKDLASKTQVPQVQPAASDNRSNREQGKDIRPAPVETGTVSVSAAAGGKGAEVQVQVQANTTAAPAPSAPPPVAPPALRPLAERISRPMEVPTTGKTGEGPRTTDPVATATATPGAATSVLAPQTSRSADSAAANAAAARAVAEGGEAEAPAPDRLPTAEGETAQTQGATATRDTALSQLSRVTIEATAQIAAQILRRLEGRSTRFEMALTPDELGRVDVKLDIDSEGRLNARLAFDNPAAATDLRGRADELRRQLEEAGFHLSKDAFEFTERNSGSSAFDRGQDSRNGSSRAFAAASRLNDEVDTDQPPGWLKLSLSPSGVDMKV